MVLLPGCGCCGEQCTCRGCVQLSILGSIGGGSCDAFAGSSQAQFNEAYSFDGASYQCVYRFLLQFSEGSGQEILVANVYLVMPKSLPGMARLFVRTYLGWTADYEKQQQECPTPGQNYTLTFTKDDMVASTGNPDSCGVLSFRVENCPPPPGTQCCCDESGFRVLYENDECQATAFSKPDFAPTRSLVFQWCGLIAEQTPHPNGGEYYYQEQVIDQFVCTTTGRYQTVDPSYTKATLKALSVSLGGVYIGVPMDNECGFAANYLISAQMFGDGIVTTDGVDYKMESIFTTELWGCYVAQCFDGRETTKLFFPIDQTTDDTCGGSGNFDPCKNTAPEVTVILAP